MIYGTTRWLAVAVVVLRAVVVGRIRAAIGRCCQCGVVSVGR